MALPTSHPPITSHLTSHLIFYLGFRLFISPRSQHSRPSLVVYFADSDQGRSFFRVTATATATSEATRPGPSGRNQGKTGATCVALSQPRFQILFPHHIFQTLPGQQHSPSRCRSIVSVSRHNGIFIPPVVVSFVTSAWKRPAWEWQRSLTTHSEVSPNNRAGCKDTECKKRGDKCVKGTLRFGTWVEIQDHGSWSWKHW